MNLHVSASTLEASICRDSFYDFLVRFWGTVIADPLINNWHIKYLCDEIQKVAERVIRRQPALGDVLINISPGTTKSTICSVMLPAWLWTRDPSLKIICGSYSHHLALHLASQNRIVLLSDKYAALYPEVQFEELQKGLIKTSKGGQRFATTTGGSVTGMHRHIIVVDDPISAGEAMSQTTLKVAKDWIEQSLSTRRISRERCPVLMIMQRLHQGDPSGIMLERRNIQHICLPAEVTPKIQPPEMVKFYDEDGLFDPKRLSRESLNKAREELGEYGYAGQYLQNPVPLSGGMFKTERLIIERLAPDKFAQVIRYWDKAGTGGGGAFTVGCKMGLDFTGHFWVLDIVRGQWEASQREKIIKQTAELDGRGVMVGLEQEPGSGGKESAQATTKALAGWRVRVDRPTGDKAIRADPYAVQVNGGNVTLVHAVWNKSYIEELMYFPLGRFKDQVDASSGGFAILTGRRLIAGSLFRKRSA